MKLSIKYILTRFVPILLVFFGISNFMTPQDSHAGDSVNLYLFYGEGCPHCEKERDFLQTVKDEYQDLIRIYQYEMYYNRNNAALLNKIDDTLGLDVRGVPLLIVGDEGIIGFGSESSTGATIRERIEFCLYNDCPDSVISIVQSEPDAIANEIQSVLGISEKIASKNENSVKSTQETLSVPILGSISINSLPLPVATFVIALMDGFNPCAMWILIFLITMLINMKDRKRLYMLGSIFIVTSALVYFVFLAAWLNFFQFIGYVYWIKVIIGLIAIFSGIFHLKNALFSKGECHAVNKKKRKSIIAKIKDITKEKSFKMAIIGIVTLAVSVNLIEVVCSAGLPSVYTNLLASADLHFWQYFLYLLFYILIFMLDDLIIFFAAVKTFEVTGITNKYTKWSSIIGGILILIIGILLIFKPDSLMFG